MYHLNPTVCFTVKLGYGEPGVGRNSRHLNLCLPSYTAMLPSQEAAGSNHLSCSWSVNEEVSELRLPSDNDTGVADGKRMAQEELCNWPPVQHLACLPRGRLQVAFT